MWRHGDVLIARIDALPASATATQGSILARGEITGHSHRVETALSAAFLANEMFCPGQWRYIIGSAD